MITGFSIVVIRCGGVADIGGVSRAHMIFNTPILWKKKSRTIEKWLCQR